MEKKAAHRPRIWDDPELMQDAVDAYFASTDRPRITALCISLGFESRQSFYDYAKRPAFSYLIKMAGMRVQDRYEEILERKDGQVTGAIFALKNMGWSDTQNNIHTFNNKPSILLDINEEGND